MPIMHDAPFVPYKLEEERKEQKEEVISLKLNLAERELLERLKKILHQEKDGTAIKQCVRIAAEVLHDHKTASIINIVFGNDRKNSRLGITTFS